MVLLDKDDDDDDSVSEAKVDSHALLQALALFLFMQLNQTVAYASRNSRWINATSIIRFDPCSHVTLSLMCLMCLVCSRGFAGP